MGELPADRFDVAICNPAGLPRLQADFEPVASLLHKFHGFAFVKRRTGRGEAIAIACAKHGRGRGDDRDGLVG